MTGFDTIFPADSVEFCPHPSASELFVCGTYKLEDQEPHTTESATLSDNEQMPKGQKRLGQCILFQQIDGDLNFSKIQEINLPAIPDMKWCHRPSSVQPILAIADSEGNITLQELDLDKKLLFEIQHISCAPSHVLCLSLDWSNRINPSTDVGSLVVSLSNGSLSLLKPDNSLGLRITDTWVAHEYEPWVAAWNYWDTNVVYSGGDDLKLKGWDIRQGFTQPTFTNKRFEAGVTCIQSNPHVEHLFAVGSYDNTVRLFDSRNPLIPITQTDVGGGAWRVKWNPSPTRKRDVLVACMHDGFKVIRFALSGSQSDNPLACEDPAWEATKRFDEHKSLAYGADWSFMQLEGVGETAVASCSFYDHMLHLWKG